MRSRLKRPQRGFSPLRVRANNFFFRDVNILTCHCRMTDDTGFIEFIGSGLTPPRKPSASKDKGAASAFSSTSTPKRSTPKALLNNLVNLKAQIVERKEEADVASHLTAAQNASKTRKKSMKLQSEKREARKVHPFPSGRGRDAIDEPSSTNMVLVVAAIPYTVRISNCASCSIH